MHGSPTNKIPNTFESENRRAKRASFDDRLTTYSHTYTHAHKKSIKEER